jgi:putative ABC transport system permease protein
MHLLLTGCRMLLQYRSRLLLSCLSIALAVVIMFMQMGFFNGLNDSQANLARILDADLIMLHRDSDNLKSMEMFRLKRWRQAMVAEGVADGTYLSTSASYWWNPQDSSRNRVLVVAVNPDHPGLRLRDAEGDIAVLRRAGTVFYDRSSRRELGDIAIDTETSLGRARVQVVGLFDLGANFSYEGHVLTSFDTYLRIFSQRNPQRLADEISLGLLKLEPGADAETVKRRLLQDLPGDFVLLTRAELEARERAHTTRSTPAGIIFGIGLLVALGIGVVICYQLLFNEIHDHMRQFATLKAIGYRARHLYVIVVSESLLLSMIGFVIGLLATVFLYRVVQDLSEIAMQLTPHRVLFILVLTLIMGIASAALAVRQVVRADPADLF